MNKATCHGRPLGRDEAAVSHFRKVARDKRAVAQSLAASDPERQAELLSEADIITRAADIVLAQYQADAARNGG